MMQIGEIFAKDISKIRHYEHVAEFYITFFEDPATVYFFKASKLVSDLLPNVKGREFVELSLYVGRTLYLEFGDRYSEGLPLPDSLIKKALSEILQAQKIFENYELFGGTTILVANNELLENKQNRFGTDATVELLKKISNTVTIFRLKVEDVHTVPTDFKNRILEGLAKSRGKTTFVFDGHGASAELSENSHAKGYFINGNLSELKDKNIPDENTSITSLELAKALEEKYVRESETRDFIAQPDVVIFTTCYSGNFMREVIDYLKSKNLPVPVLISETEVGQIGYGDSGNVYGSDFLSNVILDLTSNGVSKPTVGKVLQRQFEAGTSNPTVFVPHSPVVTGKKKTPLKPRVIQVGEASGSDMSSA